MIFDGFWKEFAFTNYAKLSTYFFFLFLLYFYRIRNLKKE